MPRSVKLSWQAGAEGSGRAGRWRKKYQGKSYYFPGGRGKSDRDAYEAAVAAWEAEKLKIDREAPRPHQREHEAAIDQWERVLAWCNRHGDREHAEIAGRKLENLRKRLTAPILRKLEREDWFESQFDSPFAAHPEWLAEIQDIMHEYELESKEQPPLLPDLPAIPAGAHPLPPVKIPQEILDYSDGSPRRIAREVWRDRLAVQKRKAASDDESLRAYVERFLKDKETQVAAGEVSVGRQYALRLHLTRFQDWLGKDTAVGEIDGDTLMRYRADLLNMVASKKWDSSTTAGHYMSTVKSFTRWLWHIEAIPALPRVLDGKSAALKISKPLPAVVIYTKGEVQSLLTGSTDRTKLYILLMLNCGMTQKDISDLDPSEVDWNEGRISRRRSKTAKCRNVPIVNYRLWPETLRLLRQERAKGSQERVLLNSNGHPILFDEISKEGKYKRNDNVKNSFDRLRKKLKIEKPLKSLKKTSATLLRDNERFSSLASLFLGHAPQSMADRHYTQAPQGLLDQALDWLGQEYGLVGKDPAAAGQAATAEPNSPTPSPQPDASKRKWQKSDKARRRQATRRAGELGTPRSAADPAQERDIAGSAEE